MLDNRMQNLDTKKEISIPKRRLRPPRYHKKDISIPKRDAPITKRGIKRFLILVERPTRETQAEKYTDTTLHDLLQFTQRPSLISLQERQFSEGVGPIQSIAGSCKSKSAALIPFSNLRSNFKHVCKQTSNDRLRKLLGKGILPNQR